MNCEPSSTAAQPANTRIPSEGTQDVLVNTAKSMLESTHPELLTALLASTDIDAPTLDIKALPTECQRLVWQLYARHYPDFASWLRELNVPAWREQFGATLHLRARDVLLALCRDETG